MNSKFLIIPVFLLGILFVGQISDSYGHGLGSETMPPIMIGDLEATLEVNTSTINSDIDGEQGEFYVWTGDDLALSLIHI